MSIEMRELVAKYRRLAGDHELNALEADSIGLNESAKTSDKLCKFYEDVADELEALLARTEAGAVGAIGEVIESDAVGRAIRLPRGWAVTLDALPVGTKIYAGSPPTGGEHMALHWIERYAAGIDDEPQIDMIRDALTHPQDASGDADAAYAILDRLTTTREGCLQLAKVIYRELDRVEKLLDEAVEKCAAMQAKEAK